MEYGLIPKLDQFNFNSQQHIQTVTASQASQQLKTKEEPQEVIVKEFLKIEDPSELNEIEKSPSKNIEKYQEVVLSNQNFGFNDSSRDFFIKVTRGDAINQYPTDDMMKLKAYLMNIN